MRAKIKSGSLASLWTTCLAAGAILGIAGCGSSTKVGAPAPQPANAANSNTNAAAKSSATTISLELVQKVTDLVRLDKEYITLAKGIQSFDDFKKNADTLSSLNERLSSLVEDIMIAEAKLSASEKADFDSKYYVPAKPVIEEQRREKARVTALIR